MYIVTETDLWSRGVSMRDKHKRKQRIFWVLLLAALVWYGSLTGSGRSGGGTYNVQAATTNVVARFWNDKRQASLQSASDQDHSGKEN